MQVSKPQGPAETVYEEQKVYGKNGNEEFSLEPNEGRLFQEGANNTVPSSSESHPVVLGHQPLGLFQYRNNIQNVIHA